MQPTPKGLTRILRTCAALSFVLAAAIAWDAYRGPQGLPRRRALQRDVARVSADNHSLARQVEGLRREVVAQKERPEVQEALVRDVLGYVRPGEVVLQPRP